MKLLDLKPKWSRPSNFPENWRTGITFLCPVCRQHRVGVLFDKPVEPDPMSPVEAQAWASIVTSRKYGLAWHREGSTFETLTLKPSVNYQNSASCWHGFVENGEIQ